MRTPPELAPDIFCLSIPTPFQVGRVNCYLIRDDPLTLIDCGPNSGKALDEMQTQLGTLGHSIDDLERVILTHQHIDHIGLVEIIGDHSGAEIMAIEQLVPIVENFRDWSESDDAFAAELMRRHGIAEDVVTVLRAVTGGFRAWGASSPVSTTLHADGRVEFADRTLEVLHRPGHSPTDTIFWDAERSLLIAGDHLLKEISSNALVTRPLDGSKERAQPLVTYMDSLRKTREMPATLILPGHGEPITEHAELIDSRFKMHERRAAKLLRLITEQPQSAYELAQALWGNVAVTQAFLTLSEVIGHVDLLVNEGRVEEVAENEIVRYHAT